MQALLKLLGFVLLVLFFTSCQRVPDVEARLSPVEMSSALCDDIVNSPHEQYVIHGRAIPIYFILSEDNFYTQNSLSEERLRVIDADTTVDGCRFIIVSGFVTSIENVLPK